MTNKILLYFKLSNIKIKSAATLSINLVNIKLHNINIRKNELPELSEQWLKDKPAYACVCPRCYKLTLPTIFVKFDS